MDEDPNVSTDSTAKYMVLGVLVELRDYPRWGIADSEIEHLALFNKDIKRVRQFLNRSRIIPNFRPPMRNIPPMNIQQIDVISLQLLQTVCDRDVKTLGRVARVIHVNRMILPTHLIRGSKLCSEHNFSPIAAFLHPLPNPQFTLFVLIPICRLTSTCFLMELHQ
jgi:hypothetical protein